MLLPYQRMQNRRAGGVVEFLPQPTLQALSRLLCNRTTPPVHVVHFDGQMVHF
jgi:hypothetical protein